MPINARDLALEVLRRVHREGAFATSALRSQFSTNPDLAPADRGLATTLVYGVLRRRGHLDRALQRCAGKRLKDLDPKLHDVLRLGAFQVMFLDRVPAHAAVSAAVDQAKRRGGPRGGGQTNAILRKLAALDPEDRLPAPTPLTEDPVAAVAEAGGLPRELAALLVRDLGPDDALAFALASLQEAPLTLRANRLAITREALMAEVGGTAGLRPLAVHLPPSSGTLPASLGCVREGRASPQDEGSMQVVELLDPRPGERVLDLCAAPGGKTTYIAERMDDTGEVVAHDRMPSKLAQVEAAAARLHLSIVRTVPALPPGEALFDRVLVDAPCTGLGTLRRHPEVRWRFGAQDLEALKQTQSQVLASGAAHVRPGGTLVYSVCTITRAEGEERLAELGDDFEIQEMIRIGPQDPGAPDGFFMARVLRRP